MTGDITMQKKQNKNISLKNVQVQDGFWKPMQDLIIETVIPYQEKILNDEIPGVEKSHAHSIPIRIWKRLQMLQLILSVRHSRKTDT